MVKYVCEGVAGGVSAASQHRGRHRSGLALICKTHV